MANSDDTVNLSSQLPSSDSSPDVFDELDLSDLDMNEEPPQIGTREVIHTIATSAIDSFKEPRNLIQLAATAASAALPKEYQILQDVAGKTTTVGVNLYNTAADTLKNPVNNLRKTVADNLTGLKGVIGNQAVEKAQQFIRPADKAEREGPTEKLDRDQMATDRLLASVFKLQNQQASLSIGRDNAQKAYQDTLLKETTDTSDALDRLTAFNDQVTYKYQYESLRLQHQQYFVARDQLALSKAVAEDTKARLDAIVHNTGLPENVKRKLKEEFQTMQRQELLQPLSTGLNNAITRYTKLVGDKLGLKSTELGQNLAGIINGITEVGSSTSKLDAKTAAMMGGSMIGDMGGGAVARTLGERVRQRLDSNPTISRYRDRLGYLWENTPQLIQDYARGKGRLTPERFRGGKADKVEDTLKRILREVTEPLIGGGYKPNLGLTGDSALEEEPFNARDSQALTVEIPGLLSRQLEVLKMIAGKDDEKETVFNPNTGLFTSKANLTQDVGEKVFGEARRSRDRLTTAQMKVLMAGRENNLSPEATLALRQAIIEEANSGHAFHPQRFKERDYGREDLNQQIQASINAESNLTRRLKAGGAVSNELRKGDVALRTSIVSQKVLGQNDALARLGLLSDDADQNVYRYMAGGEFPTQPTPEEPTGAVNLNRSKVRSTIPPTSIPEPREPAWGLDDLRHTFFNMYEQRAAIPVYMINQTDQASASMPEEPIGPITGRPSNPLYDLVRGGFNGVTRRLDDLIQIGDGMLGGQEEPAQRATTASPRRRRSAAQRINRLRQAPKSVIGSLFNKLNPFGGKEEEREPYDIYVAGNQLPTLTKAGFENQEYFDRESQKPLAGPWSIKGPVVNMSGDTVLDSVMVDRGLLDAEGNRLTDVVEQFRRGVEDSSRRHQSLSRRLLGWGSKMLGWILRTNRWTARLAMRFGKQGAKVGWRAARKAYDIFVWGISEPKLTAAGILNGEYVDKRTGKVIHSVDDITGPVLDQNGNEVLSARDARRGLYSSKGAPLIRLAKIILAPFTETVKAQTWLTRKLFGGARATIHYFTHIARDVYVRGETEPKLVATYFRAGRYISVKTQKVVRFPADIDGPIMDARTEEVVLTEEDIRKGLVDVHGHQVAEHLTTRLARTVGRVAATAGRAAKFFMNAQLKAIQGVGNVITGGLSGLAQLLPWWQGHGTKYTSKHNLDDILAYMQKRWPMPTKVEGDANNDGVRDNSWQAIFKRTGRVSEDDQVEMPEEDNAKKKSSKGDNIFSMILSGIGSMANKIIKPIKWIGETVAAWFAFDKAAKAGSAIEEGIDDVAGGAGRGGKGRIGRIARKGLKLGKGLIGKVGGLAKGAGGLLATAATGETAAAIGSAVVSGASAVASGVGSVLAGIGSLFSAPVIAAAAAVGGVAYGGYKLYKYEHRRRKVKPIERLRYLMYGFDPKIKEHLVNLRYLEEEMDDHIKGKGKSLRFDLSMDQVVKEFASDFGVNMEHAIEKRWFASWFAKRFYPIYMVSRGQLEMLSPSTELDEVDDKLTHEQKVSYLKAITASRNYPTGIPWYNTAPPVAGFSIDVNPSQITSYVNQLMKEYSDQKKEDEKSSQTKDASKSTPDQKATNSTVEKQSTQEGSAQVNFNASKQASEAFALQPGQTIPTTAPSSSEAHSEVDTHKSFVPPVATKQVGTATSQSIRLILPVSDPISSPYGPRKDPLHPGKSEFHKGVDFASPVGTPIHASADGQVLRIYRSKSYGNVIYLRHSNGMCTRYAHQSRFAPGLKAGMHVKQGDIIGYTGSTGWSTGPHLHWELRKNDDQWGPTLNPMDYVSASVRNKHQKAVSAIEKGTENQGSDLEGVDTVTASNQTLRQANRSTRSVSSADVTTSAVLAASRSTSAQHLDSQNRLTHQFDTQNRHAANAYAQRESMIKQMSAMLDELKALNKTMTTVRPEGEGNTGDLSKSIDQLNAELKTLQSAIDNLPGSTSQSSTKTGALNQSVRPAISMSR